MGKNIYRDLKEAIENPKLRPIGVNSYDAGRERARQMIGGYISMWGNLTTTCSDKLENKEPVIDSIDAFREAIESIKERGKWATTDKIPPAKFDGLDMDKIIAEATEAEFSIVDDGIESTPENDKGYHHTIMGIDVGSGDSKPVSATVKYKDGKILEVVVEG